MKSAEAVQTFALGIVIAAIVAVVVTLLWLLVTSVHAAKPVKQCREVTYHQAATTWKSKHTRCFRV